MNIFDYLKDIIQLKSNKVFEDDEELDDFNAFITQRWLSMYSSEVANICNETTNKMWRSMETKQMWYKMFQSLIPSQRIKRINYIKKAKKETNKIDREILKVMARTLEISERECKLYIEQELLNLKQLKKEFNL